MNHPGTGVLTEMAWMAEMGLEFIDLTLEPPGSAAWEVDPKAIRAALDRYHLAVVGHTAFYLPMGSAFEAVRRGAVTELKRCIDVFAEIGVPWMNLHPDSYAPMNGRAFYIRRNLESIGELLEHTRGTGVELMIENLPGAFNSARQLSDLLDPLPELGLHLDIGHANLQVPRNTTDEILAAYGQRLRHVHLHDNKGGREDLHMPLGTGTVEVRAAVRALQDCGYDGTITLEVFTPDRSYLAASRDMLRRLWNDAARRVGQGSGTA